MDTIRARTAAVFAAGAAVLLPAAQAHVQHATNCKPAGTATKGLNYSENGVYGLKAGGVKVVCPVDRNAEAPAGSSFIVWLYGTTAGHTVSCNLASYSYTGQFLGSTGADITANVFQVQLVLLAAQVPPSSAQVLECTLPPGAGLFGYEPLL